MYLFKRNKSKLPSKCTKVKHLFWCEGQTCWNIFSSSFSSICCLVPSATWPRSPGDHQITHRRGIGKSFYLGSITLWREPIHRTGSLEQIGDFSGMAWAWPCERISSIHPWGYPWDPWDPWATDHYDDWDTAQWWWQQLCRFIKCCWSECLWFPLCVWQGRWFDHFIEIFGSLNPILINFGS